MVIHEKSTQENQLDDKAKWKVIMDFMKKNPKTLVDALPDPEEDLNQTMYNPIYDQIIDQENAQDRANINSSEAEIYQNNSKDALSLNSHDRKSFSHQSEVPQTSLHYPQSQDMDPDPVHSAYHNIE